MPEVLDDRLNVDSLPAVVSASNKEEFVRLYTHHELIVKRKPFMDQLILGLNHYGVSVPHYCSKNGVGRG